MITTQRVPGPSRIPKPKPRTDAGPRDRPAAANEVTSTTPDQTPCHPASASPDEQTAAVLDTPIKAVRSPSAGEHSWLIGTRQKEGEGEEATPADTDDLNSNFYLNYNEADHGTFWKDAQESLSPLPTSNSLKIASSQGSSAPSFSTAALSISSLQGSPSSQHGRLNRVIHAIQSTLTAWLPVRISQSFRTSHVPASTPLSSELNTATNTTNTSSSYPRAPPFTCRSNRSLTDEFEAAAASDSTSDNDGADDNITAAVATSSAAVLYFDDIGEQGDVRTPTTNGISSSRKLGRSSGLPSPAEIDLLSPCSSHWRVVFNGISSSTGEEKANDESVRAAAAFTESLEAAAAPSRAGGEAAVVGHTEEQAPVVENEAVEVEEEAWFEAEAAEERPRGPFSVEENPEVVEAWLAEVSAALARRTQ